MRLGGAPGSYRVRLIGRAPRETGAKVGGATFSGSIGAPQKELCLSQFDAAGATDGAPRLVQLLQKLPA